MIAITYHLHHPCRHRHRPRRHRPRPHPQPQHPLPIRDIQKRSPQVPYK